MKWQRGTTMTDVIFLMMILSIAIIPTSGLFPMGRLTVQKAKDIQSASFLARSIINQYRCTWPGSQFPDPVDLTTAFSPDQLPTTTQTLDGTDYTIYQTLYDVQHRAVPVPGSGPAFEISAIDVVIEVQSPSLVQPVKYTTRLFKDMQEMQKL